jgi:hypothetical protein
MIQNFQFASFICFVLLDLLFLTSIFEVWSALQRTIQKKLQKYVYIFARLHFSLGTSIFSFYNTWDGAKKSFLGHFLSIFSVVLLFAHLKWNLLDTFPTEIVELNYFFIKVIFIVKVVSSSKRSTFTFQLLDRTLTVWNKFLMSNLMLRMVCHSCFKI